MFGLGSRTGAAQNSAASSQELRLRIDCPQLSRDASAALEARARTELALAQPQGGVASVRCTEGRATLTWRMLGAARGRTSVVELSSETSDLVEQLLEGLYELLTADARGRSGGSDDPAAQEARQNSQQQPNAGEGSSRGESSVSASSIDPSIDSWPDAGADPEHDTGIAPRRKSRRGAAGRLATSASLGTEAWFAPFLAVGELGLGAQLWPVDGFGFAVSLRGRMAVNSPDQTSIVGAGSALGIVYRLDERRWKLHASAGFDRWFVHVDDAETDKDRHADLLSLSAGAALEVLSGSPSLHVLPTLRFYPNPLLVRRDGVTVVQSARFAPALFVSAEF